MGITPERSFDYEYTKKIADNFIKKINNRITFSTSCCVHDDFPTYVTYVKNKDSKLITRGNGKGIGVQSELSSIFEAIEHTFYESYFQKNIMHWKGVKRRNFQKVITNCREYFKGNPYYENIKNYKKPMMIPCKRFKNLFTKKALDVPLYMYGPSYPFPALNVSDAVFVNSVYYKHNKLEGCFYRGDSEERYKDLLQSLKYCSSVGGASGIDEDETILHALNEVIERDTTSEFLLKSVVHNINDNYAIVKNESIVGENKSIIDYIESNYGIKIIIVDITGEIGIPTIMVFDLNNKFGKETLLTGYGTSLSINYAIQRALLEYKQTIDLVLYDNTLPKDDNYKDVLNSNCVPEFFKKIYYFDQKELVMKIKKVSEEELFQRYQLDDYCANSKTMLNEVIRRLKLRKYDVFYNTEVFRCNKNRIYYIKTIIPQMCDITDPGPLRLPTKRKIEMIKKEVIS